MSRRTLQALLRIIGTVATLAGLRGVFQGAGEVPGGGLVSANVDSEYRFYASWYPIMGVLLLRAARRPETDTAMIRAGAAGYLLAATARGLSIRSHGLPHRSQRLLMGLELLIPAVLIPWQSKVAAAGLPKPRSGGIGSG